MGTTLTRWCRRATHASSRRRRAVWSVPDERGCVWASTTEQAGADSTHACWRGRRRRGRRGGRSGRKRRSASPKMVFISGACERACAGVLLLPGRFWHCRLVSVPGLGPPFRTLSSAAGSSESCIPDAFGAAGSSRSCIPDAFSAAGSLDPPLRTLFAPQARWLDSLPQFPDAFGAAGSSRSLSQTLLAPRARLDPPFWTLLAPQARLDPAFWTLLF